MGGPAWVGRHLLPALTGAAMLPGLLSAQERLRGRIIEEGTERPIAGATVEVALADTALVASVDTDERGFFQVALEQPGRYRIQVRRLGYATRTSQTFAVPNGETVDLFFRLEPEVIELEGLNVQGDGRRWGRDVFEERREAGRGVFVDREQIVAHNPTEVGEIFEIVEGVDLYWTMMTHDDGDRRLTPQVESRLGRGCLAYMIDDVPILSNRSSPWTTFPLSGLQPDEIMGVEVYRSIGEVPTSLKNQAFVPRAATRSRGVPAPGAGRGGAQTPITTKWYIEETCGVVVFRTKPRW